MADLVLMRPLHFPPGREDVGLAWLRDAMTVRQRAGMRYYAIMRSQTDRHDYLAVMIWPDPPTYEAWHASDARHRLFADQPHYLVRESTRRYTLLDPEPREVKLNAGPMPPVDRFMHVQDVSA